MAKSKKSKLSVLPVKINERSLLVVLALILVASVAVLIVQDKRGTQLIDPVTFEQSVSE